MKNYKQIKSNIKKYFAQKRKEYKTAPRVWVGRDLFNDPTPAQREKAIKQLIKEEEKYIKELDQIAAAPDVSYISINTEWVKNRYWGNNPHTTARVGFVAPELCPNTYTGRASGCGYDKYSAAVTQALNQSDAIKKVICEHLHQLKKAGRYPHSCNVWNCCGLPRLCTNGSGISTLRGVFECCGFKCEEDRSGKHSDYLHFYKK